MSEFARLVLLDCDGTLVDSQAAIVAAMVDAFAACGLGPPEDAAVRRIVGLSLPSAMAVLVPEAEAGEHHRLADAYKDAHLARRLAGEPQGDLFDGALAAIDSLAADGHVLGVATGKSRRGLDSTLERFGLHDRFAVLQTADDAPSKPHPAMVEQAMFAAGAVPETTVMVGDTTFDMTMARAAGVAAIGVAWGYHEASDLHEAGAVAVLDAFDGLAGLVAKLL
jgi:phosphoglycolate phosphatase